eukprot:m.260065 g.260065  ORF g.260065 m.260065 type:complete len:114 (+) comp19674_c0_seq2:90-431(+)
MRMWVRGGASASLSCVRVCLCDNAWILQEVSRTRAAGSAPQVNWTHAFAKLPPVLAVEPITAGDCAEVGGPDQCVGVRTLPGGDGHRASTEQRLGRTPSRQCVCYGDSPNVDE